MSNPFSPEKRAEARKNAMYPEASDGRHTYRWSEYGIRVHANSGDWEGFYALRHCRDPNGKPTRLILTGIAYGNPPGELAVHFVVMCDIIKYITGEHPGDPKYNLEPGESGAAEEHAKFLST